MSATRERPLFSPSRRPLSAAVAVVPPPPTKPEVPEQPRLSLVGTVIGATESIGIFVEKATNEAVRLRVGEGHDGWVLQVIDGRKATFERDQRQVTLALPGRSGMDRQQAPMPASAATGRQQAGLIRAQGTRPASQSGK
jgi:general secretion pathway protein N